MMARMKREVPFVILLLPFAVGIGVGLWLWPVVHIRFLLAIFLSCLTSFTLLNLGYQRLKLYQQLRWLPVVLLHALLLSAGWLSTSLQNELNRANHFSRHPADALWVQLNSEPKKSARYLRFTAVVKQVIRQRQCLPASGNLLLIMPVTPKTGQLNYGDELLLPATYTAVTPPYNPAEFNYKQYLAYQNIHYQAFIAPGKFAVVKPQTGNLLITYALGLRQRLADRFKAGIKDTAAAAVASTLMLGYKADLSSELLQAYSKTGTIHVLSVSGAHVAIIYALIVFVLSVFNGNRRGQLFNALLSVLLIWGYALLTGFSPAVCRAALMISFFIAGKTLYQHLSALNILAASAFLLLLYNPFLLADVGFQLSYLAMLGLFVVQPVLYNLLKLENKWFKKLWYLCTASVAAQLLTFPLSIYYFHQFPVYFLISNLFILLPSELIIVLGAAYLLFYVVPYLSSVLAYLLEHTLIFMNNGLYRLEHLPYASAGGLWITLSEYGALMLFIVTLPLFIIRKQTHYLQAGLICLLLFCLSISYRQYQALSGNTLVFFNLKKHSGLLFRSGRRAVLMTDVPAGDPTFAYSLQPYMDSSLVNDNRLIDFSGEINTEFCRKKGNYMQFLNRSLLIISPGFSYYSIPEKVKVNYVFVTGSAHPNLRLLAQSYMFGTIVADANNSNKAVEKLREQAAELGVKFICLKRNKSFILASN